VPAPEYAAGDNGWGYASNTAGSGSSSSAAKKVYEERKIIRNASLNLETRNFDEDLEYIRNFADELGGYIGTSSISGRKPEAYGDSGRSARFEVRIPQNNMEAFIAGARGRATVVSESTESDDVTANYFDVESRLAIYRTQYDRILELLAQADDINAIIALENELSRLTYEIESLTTQLKRWDDLVTFATVSVSIKEIPPVMAAAEGDSVGTRISEGFQSTLYGLGVFFEEFAIFFIAALPVLVVLAVLAVIIVLICKAAIKRSTKKKQAAEAKKQDPAKTE
jgi:preprotein translocase subunit Sec61beta